MAGNICSGVVMVRASVKNPTVVLSVQNRLKVIPAM